MDFSYLGAIFLVLILVFFIICTVGFWILKAEIKTLKFEAVNKGYGYWYKDNAGNWNWSWKHN